MSWDVKDYKTDQVISLGNETSNSLTAQVINGLCSS